MVELEVRAFLVQRIEHPVHLDAGQAENRVDALVLQLLHECLSAGHDWHMDSLKNCRSVIFVRFLNHRAF